MWSPARAQTQDPLRDRVISEFTAFTGWLEDTGSDGFIGEFGWPDNASGDSAQWNALAEQWLDAADSARIPVTAWSTGEWWGDSYKLSIYEDLDADPGVDTPNDQAPVLEAHVRGPGLRGINVAGGEFGTPGPLDKNTLFSNRNPGVYNEAYHYDSQKTFDFLASRGLELVRIPFRWERIQRRLGGALHDAESRRLKRVVGRAQNAGLRVILDMHNYGAYWRDDGSSGVRRAIGTRLCKVSDFVDVWRRIARHLGSEPGVLGLGLMNEPVDMPRREGRSAARLWENASQRAVAAIRAGGSRKVVVVGGYRWSSVRGWSARHPQPWIDDPLRKVWYEAHHYWDSDGSGRYVDTYDVEAGRAAP